MKDKLIDKIKLENGLTLEFYDRSRPVASDRWLVSFIARVGDKVTYRHEKTRNFIAETEKDQVFDGLKERFLAASLAYLSNPDFPRKLILMQYQKARGQVMNWKSQ